MISRNFKLGEETERIIRSFFNADGRFLDYAGGYGFFTRHMRDKGFDFLHTDRYCENLFARYFELDDCPFPGKFELLTAFEVFEHLADPLTEIGKMFEYADSILFSTEIVPATAPGSIDDWWYFAPETGQHISFYTLKSLEYLAEKFQCNFYTNGITLHLFSKRAFNDNPLMVAPVREKFLLRKLRKWVKKLEAPPPLPRQSLLERDWAFVKNHLKN
nr:class I SAM-dependent methyltransferase [Chitinophaga japonensis]